jgi:hypothetical protein
MMALVIVLLVVSMTGLITPLTLLILIFVCRQSTEQRPDSLMRFAIQRRKRLATDARQRKWLPPSSLGMSAHCEKPAL